VRREGENEFGGAVTRSRWEGRRQDEHSHWFPGRRVHLSSIADVSLPADDGVSAAEPGRPRTNRLVERLSRLADAPTLPPTTRRLAFVAAAVLFVCLAVFSFASLPDRSRLTWWPAAILLATAPLIAVVNAAEFRVMAAINLHPVGWPAALRLAVMSGVANLLPVPGGVLIRTEALHRRGSSYRRALVANAAAGFVWIGTAASATGVLLLFHESNPLTITVLLGLGVACIVTVGALLSRSHADGAGRLLTRLVVVEASTVAISAVRIYLSFAVIGLDVSAVQSVALTSAQILAAAIGFFPAGLGLRELIAGAIGSAVDLQVSSAIAATVADRIFDQIGLSIVAAGMLVANSRHSSARRPPD
jgi:hypothetical protein